MVNLWLLEAHMKLVGQAFGMYHTSNTRYLRSDPGRLY
jgi:hypothetical protein